MELSWTLSGDGTYADKDSAFPMFRTCSHLQGCCLGSKKAPFPGDFFPAVDLQLQEAPESAEGLDKMQMAVPFSPEFLIQ